MHPSELADKFVVRLPNGMRTRIRQRAAANRRSMNSEIVFYLDRALAADETESPETAVTVPGSEHPAQPLTRNSNSELEAE